MAEAFIPDASVESIIDIALTHVKEGTRSAISAVGKYARQYDDWKSAIGPQREAMRPLDGAAEMNTMLGNGTNDWQPSRKHSVEEVPIALAFLVVTAADYEASIFGATNYGRDNDSIAGMAGAIAGALHGAQAIRLAWIAQINRANRVDLHDMAHQLTQLTCNLQQRQFAQAQARERDVTALLTAAN